MAKKEKDSHAGHNHSGHKVTTLDLIKRYLSLKINEMSPKKKSVNDANRSLIDQMNKAEINHIAIVLDGTVEDVIRCQNRMAALLLSNPDFIDFNPDESKVVIGAKYDGKSFIVEDADNAK